VLQQASVKQRGSGLCWVLNQIRGNVNLHRAVARLTWVGGLVMMMLFWIAAYYTALLLVRCLPAVHAQKTLPVCRRCEAPRTCRLHRQIV
jgi:hypothetical protein